MEMHIQEQIRTLRNQQGLSQRELADMIYVSRQSISNWERGKSYPDLQSLMLLSSAFNVTVDQLIKGDLSMMEKQIEQFENSKSNPAPDRSKVEEFNRIGNIFSACFIAVILMFVPVAVFGGWVGFVFWFILYAGVMVLACRVEKLKKENQIQTYKEIVAFGKGESLNETEKIRESGKIPYQNVIKVVTGALVGAVIAGILFLVI